MKRMASSLIVALLFLGLFVLAFTVQPARAQGIIYINPDGSITPSTANVTTSDNVTYTFTGNNYLTIVVNRSNTIINGGGYTLQVSGGIGFYLEYPVNNVTIENTNIANSGWGIDLNVSYNDTLSGNNITANSHYGIGLWWSHGDVLSGNNITANGGDGVYLEGSFNNILSGNNITANSYGIDLKDSSDNNILSGNTVTANGYDGIDLYASCDNNTLSGNTVTANSYGIDLRSSSGNTLSGNVMVSNTYNFVVYGGVLSHFVNNVDTSNLVDGKPVCYLMDQSNIVISPQTYPTGIGYLGLVNCKNVTAQDLTLTENGQGLLLAYTNDSTITHNNVTENRDGIYLYNSPGNVLSGNNIINNSWEGVYLYSSSNCTVSGNNITNNSDCGVLVDSYCDYTAILGNNITNSIEGVYIEPYCNYATVLGNNITDNSGDGIDLYSSSNCTVSGNNITNSSYEGAYLYSSSNCTVSGNNITNSSDCGVYLEFSSGNTFYHNNFINNTQQVYSDGSPNTWDNGYPSGGNYWSDYLTRYPNATEIDHTGIGDTPYEIDANNTDYYPLMTPYETTSPTITILSPENKTYAVNASIPLTFTVDRFASWMGYCLDGQANVTITGNATLPTLLDGWHDVSVYANDTFGNMGSATVYFTVDTTKPNITNVVQDPLTDILPDTAVKINATVTDAISGIKQVLLNCTFTNSTNTWYAEFSMTHLTGDIWNATIQPQPYGTNVTYVIIAEDNAGNSITSEQIYGYTYEYPVVPEFPSPAVFFAFVMATVLMAVAVRKKRNRILTTPPTPHFLLTQSAD